MVDGRFLIALIAGTCSLAAYVPYLTNMLFTGGKPHTYTWLIWSISTGTAAAGLWYGGGGWGALTQTISAVCTFFFFLASLRYGTRDITFSDTAVLAIALCAIGVWVFLNNPLLAVLMVTAIDALAYIPTYRKLWNDPKSEPLIGWSLWTISCFLSLCILQEYNLLTVMYLAMTFSANCALIAISVVRRSRLA